MFTLCLTCLNKKKFLNFSIFFDFFDFLSFFKISKISSNFWYSDHSELSTLQYTSNQLYMDQYGFDMLCTCSTNNICEKIELDFVFYCCFCQNRKSVLGTCKKGSVGSILLLRAVLIFWKTRSSWLNNSMKKCKFRYIKKKCPSSMIQYENLKITQFLEIQILHLGCQSRCSIKAQ